ncbi:MAG: signal recognition particle subunit SRP19/SEC65 family protein [Candidatus Thalassarchaeum sp.]|jgi:signal recognition particle subunit SEC65|nr:signal recognition particle subunit SRP19/SEC65 family protein [Candidatus Thalassarchaeum sp.]
MAERKDEMWVWTGYFDSRLSRSAGRRVPSEASVPNPTLDSIAWAARAAGITRMRRKAETSHPSRPHAQEGRLELSVKDALSSTKAESKEGVLQTIGLRLRTQMKEARAAEAQATARGPAKGNRQQRAQRKSFRGKSSGQRKKRFGRR